MAEYIWKGAFTGRTLSKHIASYTFDSVTRDAGSDQVYVRMRVNFNHGRAGGSSHGGGAYAYYYDIVDYEPEELELLDDDERELLEAAEDFAQSAIEQDRWEAFEPDLRVISSLEEAYGW